MQSIAGSFLIFIWTDDAMSGRAAVAYGVDVLFPIAGLILCVVSRARVYVCVRFRSLVLQVCRSKSFDVVSLGVAALAAGVGGRCDEVEVAGPLVPLVSGSIVRLCIARPLGRACAR